LSSRISDVSFQLVFYYFFVWRANNSTITEVNKWRIVPTSDDDDLYGTVSEMLRKELKTYASASLSIRNPT
jgi:hypothetical protein